MLDHQEGRAGASVWNNEMAWVSSFDFSYAEISCACVACAVLTPERVGEIPVPTIASVGRGCSFMRLAMSRLDTPRTTANFLCHSLENRLASGATERPLSFDGVGQVLAIAGEVLHGGKG